MQNISGINPATWKQKLAADIPSFAAYLTIVIYVSSSIDIARDIAYARGVIKGSNISMVLATPVIEIDMKNKCKNWLMR